VGAAHGAVLDTGARKSPARATQGDAGDVPAGGLGSFVLITRGCGAQATSAQVASATSFSRGDCGEAKGGVAHSTARLALLPKAVIRQRKYLRCPEGSRREAGAAPRRRRAVFVGAQR